MRRLLFLVLLLLWMCPVQAATLLTDNFDRANASPVGGIWSTVTGNGTMNLISNALRPNGAGSDAVVRNTSVTWPADQWAEVTLTTLNNSFAGGGVGLRAASAANTIYRCTAKGPFGASAPVRIDKLVAGVFTSLTTGTATLVSGDALRCEIEGFAITLKINGTTRLGPFTDPGSSIAAGNAGIVIFVDAGGAVTDGVVDNFVGGDFTGAVVAVKKRAIQY